MIQEPDPSTRFMLVTMTIGLLVVGFVVYDIFTSPRPFTAPPGATLFTSSGTLCYTISYDPPLANVTGKTVCQLLTHYCAPEDKTCRP